MAYRRLSFQSHESQSADRHKEAMEGLEKITERTSKAGALQRALTDAIQNGEVVELYPNAPEPYPHVRIIGSYVANKTVERQPPFDQDAEVS